MNNDNLLTIDKLQLHVSGFRLLKDISMQLQTGKVYSLMGRNGVGKSSLIKAITTDMIAHSGSIKLLGKNISSWKLPQLAKQLAVLPQHSNLTFNFSAIEVVMLGRSPHKTSNAYNRQIALDALEALGISYLINRPYPVLSGGEKQRVQLARILSQVTFNEAMDSERLIILDEPINSLDMHFQHQILTLLNTITANNISVFMVLHDLNHALHYSSYCYLLHDFQLFAEGKTSDVLTTDSIKKVFDIGVNNIQSNDNNFILQTPSI